VLLVPYIPVPEPLILPLGEYNLFYDEFDFFELFETFDLAPGDYYLFLKEV
jgi:hypothetical protein